MTRAFHGPQAITDDLVGDGFEPVEAPVHIRRLKRQPHLLRVFKQHLELVGVIHFHRHVGAEELGGVVHLEPAGVIRQQGISGCVRLVEAVARKLLHQVEHLVSLLLADALLGSSLAEDGAVFGHLLGLLLAHGPAQHVGAAQAVTAQDLSGLHHLLLVHHDPVSLGQHRLHQRVGVDDLFLAMLSVHEAGNQVHGPWPVQRVQGNQIFQPAGARLFQHTLHATAFKLEHRFSLTLGEQPVRRPVVERNVLERKVLLALVALDDELARNLQNGERCQPQKVELDQSDGFHVVLVVLAHGRLAARLLVQRAEIGEFAGRDQHAAGMHADVARHALELLRHLDDGLDVLFLAHALVEHGLQF